MALIECDECGHQISSKAITCPNCGNPQSTGKRESEQSTSSLRVWLIAFAIFAGLILIVFLFYKSDSAYITAMTSEDLEKVSEAIDTINDCEQLHKIADRCSREADRIPTESLTVRSLTETYGEKMSWVVMALRASGKKC